MKIAVFFASETGNTKSHAYDIVNFFCEQAIDVADPKDVSEFKLDDLEEFDLIIFGSPTWNIGELQADLNEMLRDLGEINLSGKLVAIYGCGDQENYPDTYQDAIGILADVLVSSNARLIGKSSPEGHSFVSSRALVDGKFLGLALDNHNQADLSKTRIQNWVMQLIEEINQPIKASQTGE